MCKKSKTRNELISTKKITFIFDSIFRMTYSKIQFFSILNRKRKEAAVVLVDNKHKTSIPLVKKIFKKRISEVIQYYIP